MKVPSRWQFGESLLIYAVRANGLEALQPVMKSYVDNNIYSVVTGVQRSRRQSVDYDTRARTKMDIDDEEGDYESTSITHEVSNGPDLVREVRWFPDSGNAYRWSERADRWIYLREVRSLNYAAYEARRDMVVIHSRRSDDDC